MLDPSKDQKVYSNLFVDSSPTESHRDCELCHGYDSKSKPKPRKRPFQHDSAHVNAYSIASQTASAELTKDIFMFTKNSITIVFLACHLVKFY